MQHQQLARIEPEELEHIDTVIDEDEDDDEEQQQQQRQHLDLIFSTRPNYSLSYLLILALLTFLVCLLVSLYLATVLSKASIWPRIVSIALSNAVIVLFVVFRVPIAYQIWEDRVEVQTVESLLLPFRIFSSHFSLKLHRIQRIEQVAHSTSPCLAETIVTLHPSTFMSLRNSPGQLLRVVVDKDMFWRNFVFNAQVEFYERLQVEVEKKHKNMQLRGSQREIELGVV